LRVVAIIVAAGRGERIGGEVSKQFIKIHGKPILLHTLEKFEQCPSIDEIVAVVPKAFVDRVQESIDHEWRLKKVAEVVAGGDERYDSVWQGLEAIGEDAGIVAIHDGVRPCISIELIEHSVRICRDCGAVIVGVPPKDTIKEKSGNTVRRTLNREDLVAVQTPQVFERNLIHRAYQRALKKGLKSTDDAALVEDLGHSITIVEGEYTNIKITSVDDLLLAKALLTKEDKQ
jgi:2-C-methyl-D-erythritol 4-phosphate cytidylyltransferase